MFLCKAVCWLFSFHNLADHAKRKSCERNVGIGLDDLAESPARQFVYAHRPALTQNQDRFE